MNFGTFSTNTVLCVLLALPLACSVDMTIDWIIRDYEDMQATVGDSVTFNYIPVIHNLYIHPSGTCDERDRRIVGSNSGDDVYVFTEEDVGKTVTFACDVASHCSQGQIVNFVVSAAPTRAPVTVAPNSQPTTSAPTRSPRTNSPTRKPSTPLFRVFLCFSGTMEVVVRGKGTVSMDTLQVGDFVKIGNAEAYNQVYAFGHRVPEKETEFVQIHTDAGPPLEMTGEHLVFLHGKINPVRADSVKVGDVLQAQDNRAVVQEIKSVIRKGIYNPLTTSGTIQVNGITASTYISFQKENNEHVELPGGIEIPLSHHDFAHRAMAPFRFYCTTFAVCGVSDASSHIPVYVSKGIEVVEWSKQQPIAVQLLVWGSFRMIILASILMAFAVFTIPTYLITGKSIHKMQRLVSLTSRWNAHSNKKNG